MIDPIIDIATKEMAESKRALLLAGLDLFSKKGVDAVSTGDLSKVTGFSRPVIFKFYKTKLEMAVDIFTICYVGIYRKLLPIIEVETDFHNQLSQLCEIFSEIIVENSDSLFMVSENLRLLWPKTKGLDAKNSILSFTITLIKSGQRRKIVDRSLSADEMGIAIVGIAQQIARVRYFADQKKSKKTIADSLYELSRRILIVS